MQKLKCFFYMTTVLLAGLFVTSMVFAAPAGDYIRLMMQASARAFAP